MINHIVDISKCVWAVLCKTAAVSVQGDAAEGTSRTGLMGVLTRNKEADALQAAMPAPQSKPGKFANLRARLGRPSEQTEVNTFQ